MTTKVLIAAGGTGGHIYPALALGEAFASGYPQVAVEYMCGTRELEVGIYRKHGVSPHIMPVRTLGAGLVGRVMGGVAAAKNTLAIRGMVKRGGYAAVVGMGGYVTGPALLGAHWAGVPTVVHEANSVPGKTNRWLAPYVTATAVHFRETLGRMQAKRGEVVGMPIRASIVPANKEAARRGLEIAEDAPVVVVLGGSQGAREMYRRLLDALGRVDEQIAEPVTILWSTGQGLYEEMHRQLGRIPLNHVRVVMRPYFEDMHRILSAADVAIARAGASTMAELLAMGIYATYVPYPFAIYDHQTTNAQCAEAAGCGVVVPETAWTPERAAAEVLSLITRARSGEALRVPPELDSRDAAMRLARLVVEVSGIHA